MASFLHRCHSWSSVISRPDIRVRIIGLEASEILTPNGGNNDLTGSES